MVATEIITAGGGVVAAAIGYLAVRHTGRQARDANRVTRDEDQAVVVSHDDVQRRRDVVESWESFTGTLQKQMAAQDAKIDGQDVKIADLVGKLADVSRKMDRAGRTLTAAIAYIERLLDFISAQLPDHPAVPVMPAEVRQQMHEH
jgi:hypothetical protein